MLSSAKKKAQSAKKENLNIRQLLQYEQTIGISRVMVAYDNE